jgi:hypothetical protein
MTLAFNRNFYTHHHTPDQTRTAWISFFPGQLARSPMPTSPTTLPLLEGQLDCISQVRKIASVNTNEDAEVTPDTPTHVEPHGTVCSILYVICPEAYIGLT